MHRSDDHRTAERQPTTMLFESFDSWAQLLRQPSPAATPAHPSTRTEAILPEADPTRPVLRRPLALLHVIDDGREDGETIRLRDDRLVIGRSEGDVLVPHDISMSSPHAALEWVADAWQLADLASAQGTFVRVLTARLHHGSCLQIGATRLRFEVEDGRDPCLVELSPAGHGLRHGCQAPATTIGRRGSGCDVMIADGFVSPVHAELRQTPGGWRVENRGLNGLWVRIDGPVRLAHPAQFLCGEQRFVFEPLPT